MFPLMLVWVEQIIICYFVCLFVLFMCCRNVHVVKEVSKDDVILHLVTNSVREGELPKDFVLLVSKRVLLER